MTRLGPLSFRKLRRALMRLGFLQVRQTGSHVVFLHEDGRRVVVPRHDREDIGVGLVRQILKQADIPLDRFLDEV